MIPDAYAKTRWTLSPVGTAVSLANGYPFDSDDFRDEGSLPLVRIRDLEGDEFSTFIDSKLPDSARIGDGDVVVGMDGEFKVVRWARGEAALNQRLCRLRAKGENDIRFVAYALPAVLAQIGDSQHATTVKHLSSGEILTSRIPLPPVEEQRRIADFLDDQVARIDAASSKVREQVALLSERSDALVELHFTQATKDCSSRTLGNLAVTGWVDIGRGDVISKETIADYPGDYPVYSSARENNGEIGKYGEYMFDEELVSWSVDGGGDVFYRQKHRFSVTNICAYARVRNKHALDTEYLALAMQRARARVSFDWQDKAHPGVVRGIYRIPLPSMKVQRELVDKNAEATSLSRVASGRMSTLTDLLEERKRALITAAVAGELDVTTAKPIGMGKWVPNVGAGVEAPAAAQASSIGGIG